MYAIFTRLNASEPVWAERLVRKRLRWLQQGTAMYAIVLIPVMFIAIIVGALLGADARSTNACEASYSVGGVSPLAGRPSCSSRFTTLTSGNLAFPPAARVAATAAGPPGVC